jgi:RNA polymerase sigma-70 factor (ECF subfamily)
MNDPELLAQVRKAQGGDLAAQGELVRRQQDRVAGFLHSLVGQPSAVEDLAQAVFIRMVLGLPGLREPAQFVPWLFRLARNAAFDHLRRQRLRRILVPWLPEHDALPAAPSSGESTEWLRAALRELPAAQREVLALVAQEGLSYEEAARAAGRSVASVKSLLFRAREALKARRARELA